MPWVRLTRDFNEIVTPRRHRTRRAGTSFMARRHIAQEVEAIGAGEVVERPVGLRSCFDGSVRRTNE